MRSEENADGRRNPYTPGSWESRNWELMMAGRAVSRQKIALVVARYELEPDEFFTANQKATALLGGN